MGSKIPGSTYARICATRRTLWGMGAQRDSAGFRGPSVPVSTRNARLSCSHSPSPRQAKGSGSALPPKAHVYSRSLQQPVRIQTNLFEYKLINRFHCLLKSRQLGLEKRKEAFVRGKAVSASVAPALWPSSLKQGGWLPRRIGAITRPPYLCPQALYSPLGLGTKLLGCPEILSGLDFWEGKRALVSDSLICTNPSTKSSIISVIFSLVFYCGSEGVKFVEERVVPISEIALSNVTTAPGRGRRG